MSRLISASVLLLGTILLPGAVASSVSVNEGAPDFALRSLDGKNLRLSEYRSQVVVLNFWSVWCGRCDDAIGSLERLYQQHKDDGLQVLSVGLSNNPEKAHEYIREAGASFPTMTDDRKKSVSRMYDIRLLPLTVVIDREGDVRYVHSSFDSGSSEQIAAEVATLLAE